ncbi:DUF3311 domain-containing protein [Streptomyces shenzhenensis]|uniref:DUF3311 domain-containing protein n=1 Tax=Streptomyces shenzhenensis TaxID=943815 RepID=UPI003411C9BB
MGETREQDPVRAARPLRLAVSGLLILIPVALALAVPLYQRTGPALTGIPFFYWFQMAMAVLAALATGTVYRLLFTGEDDGGETS